MVRHGLSLTAMLFFATAAGAAVLEVPEDYQSIQDAIDAAENGDEIVVSSGIYHETLNLLGKAVHLRSLAGAESTIIDGHNMYSAVVTCNSGEGPETIIEGFRIRNGTGNLRGGRRFGGGMDNYMASPTVRNCIFTGNTADGGGGMHNFASFAVIDGCRFSTNVASIEYGGGGMHNYGGAPTIVNCQFSGNTSIRAGGGMLNLIADPQITNCLFIDNTAELGGGMRNESSCPTVSNCTFADNFVYNSGGAVHNVYAGSEPMFVNCIFWNNDAAYVAGVLDQAGAAATVTYSNVEGGWDGNGAETGTNMSVDPQFSTDCHRLSGDSLCVDAGDNEAVPEEIETDLDGNDRITSVAVDMGAYECQTNAEPSCPADLTGDGSVDVNDLLSLFGEWGTTGESADIDGDGFVDVSDLMLLLQNFGPCP